MNVNHSMRTGSPNRQWNKNRLLPRKPIVWVEELHSMQNSIVEFVFACLSHFERYYEYVHGDKTIITFMAGRSIG